MRRHKIIYVCDAANCACHPSERGGCDWAHPRKLAGIALFAADAFRSVGQLARRLKR